MKTQNNFLENKSNSTFSYRLFCLFVIILTASSCIYAQEDSALVCNRVRDALQENVEQKAKLSSDSAVAFLPSKDKRNAFKQAQDLCIRMGARVTEIRKEDPKVIYALPGSSGEMTLVTLEKDDCVYVVLYLGISCHSYPVKEIRYVRSKCYNEVNMKEKDSPQKTR